MSRVSAVAFLLLLISIALWARAYEPDIRRKLSVSQDAGVMAVGMANSCSRIKDGQPAYREHSYTDNRA